MKKIIESIVAKFKKPVKAPPVLPQEERVFALDIIQADLIQRLFCDEELAPAVVASKFYKRYPRRQWRNLWDYDPVKDEDYLTEPSLFVEGCELADAAMRALGHVTVEKDGKEYLSTESPFFWAMQRAMMN